jgi:DNA-directed RNA polymerase subunit RPC12/RpoP
VNILEQLGESFKEMVTKEPPASYLAAGKRVVCGHCSSEIFSKKRVLVRGPLSYCLVCTKCSLAIWFENAPDHSNE